MKVDELSAIVADCVVMPISLPVVTAGAVAKLNFMNESRLLQKPERVVDGGITNRRQVLTRRLENFIRRGMIFPRTNDLKHRIALARQFSDQLFRRGQTLNCVTVICRR